MNEPQLPNNGLWYFDVSEKEMNFSGRLRHINSKTHIHRDILIVKHIYTKKNMASLLKNMKLLNQKLMK